MIRPSRQVKANTSRAHTHIIYLPLRQPFSSSPKKSRAPVIIGNAFQNSWKEEKKPDGNFFFQWLDFPSGSLQTLKISTENANFKTSSQSIKLPNHICFCSFDALTETGEYRSFFLLRVSVMLNAFLFWKIIQFLCFSSLRYWLGWSSTRDARLVQNKEYLSRWMMAVYWIIDAILQRLGRPAGENCLKRNSRPKQKKASEKQNENENKTKRDTL